MHSKSLIQNLACGTTGAFILGSLRLSHLTCLNYSNESRELVVFTGLSMYIVK